MSAAKELFDLQGSQKLHDERFHKDIWCLSLGDRIKHMVLHFAKYSGRFIEAKERQDINLLTRTLIDTWIIALASANMLNLKLGKQLGADPADLPSLSSLGQTLLASRFPLDENPFDLAISELSKATGHMAKACESYDHMEGFDSRGCLEKGVVQIAVLSLATSSLLKLDLVPLVYKRWGEVERKSIFAPS